jgi:hypothetical protein
MPVLRCVPQLQGLDMHCSVLVNLDYVEDPVTHLYCVDQFTHGQPEY